MAENSIGVQDSTKETLRQYKREGETWDRLLERLAEDYDQDGKRWTEAELRDLIRDELESYR